MGCASVGAEASPGRAVAANDARAACAEGPVGRWRCPLGRLGEEERMARFINAQVPEMVQPFWAALQHGECIADAAVAAGT